jgi:heme exporter protein C
VFAITAGAFVPLNFAAVRAAQSLVHPRTFATAEGGMPGDMWLTFGVCFAGIAALWATLVSFELTAKRTSAQLSRLRRAIEGAEPATGVGARIAPGAAPAGGGS